jgi:hypothetical protein
MVRLLVFIVLACSSSVHAQVQLGWAIPRPVPQPLYRNVGVLSASTTLAPGLMLNRNQVNFHFHSFAEYHLNRSVSVKSDSYLFLNSPNLQIKDLKMIRSYFGMFYHFNRRYFGNWDVKVGFLPGITYSQQSAAFEQEERRVGSLAPSFSFAVGFDYYVWKYFHFFSQVSYVQSTMRGLPNGSERADELLFSVGLGFQVPTRK